ncbi:hypothetical protein HK101_005482 [Irineochytrium annulatum]|nr:hypothetical protein HK101_005482 [Irineochytrium annulatum]
MKCTFITIVVLTLAATALGMPQYDDGATEGNNKKMPSPIKKIPPPTNKIQPDAPIKKIPPPTKKGGGYAFGY